MTDDKEESSKLENLANDHWVFVRECLDKFSNYEDNWTHENLVEQMEWSFKHGFTHGFKHGLEEEI